MDQHIADFGFPVELFQSGPIVIFRWKFESNWPVMYATDNVIDLLGIAPHDFYSGSVTYGSMVHPNDMDRVYNEVMDAVSSGVDDFDHEPYRIITPLGFIKWVQDHTHIDRDDDGNVLGFVGYVFDISQQVKDSNTVRGLYNKTPAMMHSVDRHANILEVSDFWLETLGYERREVIGRPITDFLPPESAKYVREKVLPEFFETGELKNIKYQMKCRNGNLINIVINSSAVWDADGKVIRSLSILDNITDYVKTTAERDMLARAVEQSPVSVFVTDPDGFIQYANSHFRKKTGLLPEEYLGFTPRVYQSGMTSPDVYYDLWHTIKSGKSWKGEMLNRHKDGTLFWEIVTISPVVRNGEIINFLAIKEDITNIKNIQRELETARDEAERANQSKTDFLANMSHELRTPLNAIIGFSEIMLMGMGEPLGDQNHEFVTRTHESSKHLLSVINDILDLSKIEAGRMDIYESNFCVGHAVYDAVKMIKPNENVDIIASMPNSMPKLFGDQQRITQVLLNLLSNAAKFTTKGSITIDTKIIDNCFRITVSDTGKGMTPEEIKTALSAYGQTDKDHSSSRDGTGLGLPIAKSFVELHDAIFKIESIVDMGTKITMTFPENRTIMHDQCSDGCAKKIARVLGDDASQQSFQPRD